MSSAVVSTSAAPGRLFLFDDESEAEVCAPSAESKRPAGKQISPESVAASVFQSAIGNRQSAIPLAPASRLEVRPAPEMVTSGIPALDALTGGLPRGCLTEICGPASSGRTSVMLAALTSATRRGEYCAVIDASDSLDPHSLAAADVDLARLLWVRCGESEGAPSLSPRFLRRQGGEFDFSSPLPLNFQKNEPESPRRMASAKNSLRSQRHSDHCLEQVLRATDLLLESGGFGLIILDLADIPPQSARRIPLTTWFRFRRAVEHKPTILLAIEQQPIAGSCSSLLLQLEVLSSQFSVLRSNQLSEDPATLDWRPSHAHLLTELKANAELIRSRLDRKPARSITFETKTAWAG
jgi:recA bacterial DNA recombination protein